MLHILELDNDGIGVSRDTQKRNCFAINYRNVENPYDWDLFFDELLTDSEEFKLRESLADMFRYVKKVVVSLPE